MNSNEEIGYEKGRSSYQPRIRCKHRDGLLPSLRRVKMIDVITVQYTRFVNLSSDGDDESRTYGYRNPYLTAYDAVALRDTISLRAGLDERFATCHASDFVVTCTEPHPARASVSVYCAEEWPESLLGDAPKEGVSFK